MTLTANMFAPDSQTRRSILTTMIELGIQKFSSRESLCLAIDAHQLLTGQPLPEQAHSTAQLQELYPHLVLPEAPEIVELARLALDKVRPISIWHVGDLRAYYEATDAERAAWNAYAEAEAVKFNNDPRLDTYDSTQTRVGRNRDGKITNWCPPLFFPEWLEQYRSGQ